MIEYLISPYQFVNKEDFRGYGQSETDHQNNRSERIDFNSNSIEHCMLFKVEEFSSDGFKLDAFGQRYYLIQPTRSNDSTHFRDVIKVTLINSNDDYKMLLSHFPFFILDEFKGTRLHWHLIIRAIIEHSIRAEQEHGIFNHLEYKPKMFEDEVCKYLISHSFSTGEVELFMSKWNNLFSQVRFIPINDKPFGYEKPDYERDYFDAMTDGQMGDYDDYREKGGNIDDLDY